MSKVILLDKKLFSLINRGLSSSFFDFIMPVFSNPVFWIPVMLFFIIYGILKFGKRFRYTILVTIISVSLSDIFCARVLKPSIKRLRPSHGYPSAIVRGKRGGKYGFPSNHAANVTALTVPFIFHFNFIIKILLILIILLVGFSRIYLGVHYPLDVFAGYFIGILFVYISSQLLKMIKNTIKDGSKNG
ncbi:MAG: phosphatase PAP2 family protein [Candidatus Marinimicrobia bacterium]|nr:phosphatase PAP2 family protein [Candidatus Neomarinimicrobiota bacterium]